MSVMERYVSSAATGAAWDGLSSIPAPPGTSLGQMSAQGLFAEISDALGLAPIGVFTPWASRTGDVDWEEIVHPDTNVMAWTITDDNIAAAQQVTFGAPLPFVAVMTKSPLTQATVASMWDGTAYSPYETQAVYRQDDAKPIPSIYYLHWGERIDISALPRTILAIGPRASAAQGKLVFAAQIPAQTSTARPAPSGTFVDAQVATMLITSPPPPPPADALSPPLPGPEGAAVQGGTPAPSPTSRLALPIAIGLGAGTLAFILWRRR